MLLLRSVRLFRCSIRFVSLLSSLTQFACSILSIRLLSSLTPFGYSNRVGRWPSTSPPKKMQISHLSDVFLLIFQLMKPVKAVNPSDTLAIAPFGAFECTGYGTSYGAQDSFGKTLAVQSDGTQDSCRIEDGLQLTGLHLEATWPHPFVALLCVADCLNKTQVKMKTLI